MSILATVAILAAFDIGAHFSEKTAWEETAVDFTVDHAQEGFVFASQKRDIVNCLKRGAATWLDREVWETRVYYVPNAGAVRVEMSLFNKGDSKSGDAFGAAEVEALSTEIQKRFGEGAKVPKPERTRLRSGGVRSRREWMKCDPTVELVWGAGDEKFADIQYVRVTLAPRRQEKPKGATKAVSGKASAARVKANVKKNPDGDVWVDGVPMVDQGQKGYCAAAVAERILRYYGHAVDEHEIAQQAGSRAEGGTRVSEMIETVRAIGSKKRLGFNMLLSMSGSLDDIAKEVDQYNKAARSMKEPDVSIERHTQGNMIMVSAIYDEMKPKVLKKMRMKDARFKKFVSGVRAQVDKGVPVCWGVTLGIFPEPGVNMQSKGGHMRLIIGYNAKTHEILYSDTWGSGHELKRMPEDWAFTITHDAFSLRPL